MRLDITDEFVGLVLSERNLLSLLTKLYTEDSACTIVGPIVVKAEKDEVHYADRPAGPGPMHPVTENIIAAVREFTEGASIRNE